MNIKDYIIIGLLMITTILITLLIVVKNSNRKLKDNQEFDYNTKRFIINSLNDLHDQYNQLFSGIRMVLGKIDDIDLTKKIENLNLKVNKLSRKVNNDYRDFIKEDFEEKEIEKNEMSDYDV